MGALADIYKQTLDKLHSFVGYTPEEARDIVDPPSAEELEERKAKKAAAEGKAAKNSPKMMPAAK